MPLFGDFIPVVTQSSIPDNVKVEANCGKRAKDSVGDVSGRGAGAGGIGNPDEYDSDLQAVGGTFPQASSPSAGDGAVQQITEVDNLDVIGRISRVYWPGKFSAGMLPGLRATICIRLVEQNRAAFQEDAIAVLQTLRIRQETVCNDSEAAVWEYIIGTALDPHRTA